YRAFRKIFKGVELVVGVFEEFYKQAAKIGNTTKIFMTFNRILRSIMNVGAGVLDVVTAIGRAFLTSFSSLNGVELEDFLRLLRNAATWLMNFTANLRLTKEASQNLEDGFTGLFSVVKLLIDAFIGLVSAIIPVNKPIGSLSNSLLELFGFMGRVLTQFTEWVRASNTVSTSCNLIGKAITGIIGLASSLVQGVGNLVKAFYELEPVQKFFEKIGYTLEDLDKNGAVYITNLVTRVKEFAEHLIEIAPESVRNGFINFVEVLKQFKNEIMTIDFSSPGAAIDSIREKLQKLMDLAQSNPAFNTFITNIAEFTKRLKEGFAAENVTSKIDGITGAIGKFAEWIKSIFVPAMQDLTVGDALAAGTTFAGLYSLVKAAKIFSPIMEAFDGIPTLLEKL
ncbi:MAG: hypothetical protein K2O54_02025, partial [Prevotella sp.]|nr:hypothetical protein [Prevotella sp.]